MFSINEQSERFEYQKTHNSMLFCPKTQNNMLFCPKTQNSMLFCPKTQNSMLFCPKTHNSMLFCPKHITACCYVKKNNWCFFFFLTNLVFTITKQVRSTVECRPSRSRFLYFIILAKVFGILTILSHYLMLFKLDFKKNTE